jgi:tRNA A37 methylthiotransferase MiaB
MAAHACAHACYAGEPASESVSYFQVPEDVREARRDELVAQQQDISAAFAESLIGREVSAAAGADDAINACIYICAMTDWHGSWQRTCNLCAD